MRRWNLSLEEEGLFQLSLSEWKGTESEASGSVSDSTINLYKSLDFKKIGVEGKFEKKLCQLTEKDHSEVKSWRAGGTMRHSHLWSRGCSGVYVGWVRFTFLFLFFFLGICVCVTHKCLWWLVCVHRSMHSPALYGALRRMPAVLLCHCTFFPWDRLWCWCWS